MLDRTLDGVRAGQSLAESLTAAGAASGPIAKRFVAQAALPANEPYEAFIARTGQVPTRDNLHDLFNGLMWLQQPILKARLNALQADEIGRAGIGKQRGPLRDALTLFDESGALLCGPPALIDALIEALRRRDWRDLFIGQRDHWAQARLSIFGHALLEKLATAPRKALTAQVLIGDPLAMTPADWASKPFLPLPVLGVPSWWPANDEPDFYDDAAVFRPLRQHAGQCAT